VRSCFLLGSLALPVCEEALCGLTEHQFPFDPETRTGNIRVSETETGSIRGKKKKFQEILALCAEFSELSNHMFDVLVPGRALVSNPQNCHVAHSFRSSFGYFSKKLKETAVDIIRVQLIEFGVSFNLNLLGLF